MASEPAHTLRKGHPHVVWPGGNTADREADHFAFLRDHIVHHLTAKREFRVPRGSASQATAAAGSASRWEIVRMEPFQDTSRPESTDDPADLSNLNTQPLLLDCVGSV